MKKSNKYRWNEVYNMSQKITRCGQESEDGCGAKQPDRLKVDGVDGIIATWNKLDTENKEVKNQKLTIENVKEIFERITDEDIIWITFALAWISVVTIVIIITR